MEESNGWIKGIILFFAIPSGNIEVPSTDFWRDEITITSTYGAAPNDLQEALAAGFTVNGIFGF